MLFSLLKRFTGSRPASPVGRVATARRGRSCRLGVELLEGRALPSSALNPSAALAAQGTDPAKVSLAPVPTVTPVANGKKGYPLPPGKGPALAGTLAAIPARPAPVLPPVKAIG
jgi:hypothetical protein